MRSINREFNSTTSFTIRNIFDLDGDRVTSAGTEVTEASFDIQESLGGDPILTLTKSGGRIVAASDLLTLKLIKGTDFTDLEPNRIYYAVIELTIGGNESVSEKFKLVFTEN